MAGIWRKKEKEKSERKMRKQQRKLQKKKDKLRRKRWKRINSRIDRMIAFLVILVFGTAAVLEGWRR